MIWKENKKIQKMFIVTEYAALMKAKVLQNAPHWPVLSDNWSGNPIFCLLESGCFTQALLYQFKVVLLIQIAHSW